MVKVWGAGFNPPTVALKGIGEGVRSIFGAVRVRVTETVWPLLDALGSEIVIVSVYVFGCRPEIFTERLIESEFPAVREPDGFDKVSQFAVFEAVQLRGASPVFLMVKVWGAGFDPPTVALKEICEGVRSIFGAVRRRVT
jgi:hypothetical protein